MSLKGVLLAVLATAIGIQAGLAVLERFYSAAPEVAQVGRSASIESSPPPVVTKPPAARSASRPIPASRIELVATEEGGSKLLFRPPVGGKFAADEQQLLPVFISSEWLARDEVSFSKRESSVRLNFPESTDDGNDHQVALLPPGASETDVSISEVDGVIELTWSEEAAVPAPAALEFISSSGVSEQPVILSADEQGVVVVSEDYRNAPLQEQTPITFLAPDRTSSSETVYDQQRGFLKLR